MTSKTSAFWDVTPCNLEDTYQLPLFSVLNLLPLDGGSTSLWIQKQSKSNPVSQQITRFEANNRQVIFLDDESTAPYCLPYSARIWDSLIFAFKHSHSLSSHYSTSLDFYLLSIIPYSWPIAIHCTNYNNLQPQTHDACRMETIPPLKPVRFAIVLKSWPC